MSARSPEPVQVAIAIVHRAGLWLVARRHDHVHLGGLWEFPGGKLLPGEDATTAALRELLEECAVAARPLECWPSIEHRYPSRTVCITPVLCEWTSGEARSLQNAACRWVAVHEFAELHWPAANEQLIDQIREWSLANGGNQ